MINRFRMLPESSNRPFDNDNPPEIINYNLFSVNFKHIFS